MSAAGSIDPAIALDVLAAEGKLAADALEGTLDESVPYCPGWTGRDLAVHLAGVYRWVSYLADRGLSAPPDREVRAELFSDPGPEDDAGVLNRLRRANALVVGTLREAPQDLSFWTLWPADSARSFWIRRMLHETVVHRVDAQNAGRAEQQASAGDDLDATVAADGVDEIVLGFSSRYRGLVDLPPAMLALETFAGTHRWWLQFGPGEMAAGRGEPAGEPTTKVAGAPGELLLLLWNRRGPAGLTVTGDPELLETWRQRAHL